MNFYRHELGFWEPQSSEQYAASYPAAGNARCYEIEARSHWFSARNRTIEWALRHFGFPGGFLDVGAGNGFQLQYLQQNLFRQTGAYSAMCEPGVDGCVNAVQRGVANVYHCDAGSFPFGEHGIGGIGLFDVIEHIEDDSGLLQQAARACPPGSRLFITVPAGKGLWSSVDTYAGHFRRYDDGEFDRLVSETGLTPLYQTRFFSYYSPMVWLLRVFPEMFRRPYTTEEIVRREAKFHHGRREGRSPVLDRIHGLEMRQLDRRRRLAVGTSMLMVFGT